MSRCITTWWKPGNIDMDFYVSENEDEARQVTHNLEKQGIHRYKTFPLGERLDHLSAIW